MITMDKGLLEGGAPNAVLLGRVLDKFAQGAERRDKLKRYAQREHSIGSRMRKRGLPNNRLAHDLPGYITAVSSGYLVGSPVQYSADGQEQALEALQDALEACDSQSVDSELARDAATYGRGVEVYYADERAIPHMAQVDPLGAFVVYDDTVAHKPLFGVTVREKLNALFQPDGFAVAVYTEREVIQYTRKSNEPPTETGRERHFFGGVPVTEYWNNAEETGDFEGVLGLIDAYDVIQSDRVNDKQQFTDALLVLYGVAGVGRPEDETDAEIPDDIAAARKLNEGRTLYMPDATTKAEYLTKQLSEGDTEVLKDSIKADIHKLSFVPDLTDREFAGNESGVAMKFKLFGLEQLTKIKERWFREGLRQRLRCFSTFLALKGVAALDPDEVTITFQRSLPVNELEIAQTVSSYKGLVPDELLLGQVPFVDDVPAALAMLQQQQEEAAERQKATFGDYPDGGPVSEKKAKKDEKKPKEA